MLNDKKQVYNGLYYGHLRPMLSMRVDKTLSHLHRDAHTLGNSLEVLYPVSATTLLLGLDQR